MRVGIEVKCTVCGKRKAPHGRSIPDLTADTWCSAYSGCPGYAGEPLPGCLWPGETEENFGTFLQICLNATEARGEA